MSEEFRNAVIVPRALALGLPEDASLDDINRVTMERVRENVDRSKGPSFRFIPSPEEVVEGAGTIEVSVPIDPQESAQYSIEEDGENKHITQLRFLLEKALVAQAMRARWVDVRIENNVAIATLVVARGGQNG